MIDAHAKMYIHVLGLYLELNAMHVPINVGCMLHSIIGVATLYVPCGSTCSLCMITFAKLIKPALGSWICVATCLRYIL